MKDIYVKFNGPDIEGESLDQKHKDWVEVSSWHHRMKQPKSATASSTGGHTAERCEHEVMEFTKNLDLVSPKLYEACSGGTTFKDVSVEFMRADGDGKRVKYLEINMKNVVIADVAPSVNGESFPTESFALNYGAIEWKYTRQKGEGGASGKTQGAWSLVKNDKTYSV